MQAKRAIQAPRCGGFTLMEVLAALTIGGLVVMSAVSATRALTTTREKIDRRLQRSGEARRAMETVVAALRNVRRDKPEPNKPVIIGTSGGSDAGGDRINLLVIGDRRVRRDGPESDQYEVAFFLQSSPEGAPPALMCRRDHAFDEHVEEGGLVTLVAENIVGLSFEYRAAEQWFREWSATEPQAPEAVRVTIAAMEPPRRNFSSPDAAADGQPERPETLVLTTIVPIHAERPDPISNNVEKPREEGKP